MLADLEYRLIPDPKNLGQWYQRLQEWTGRLPGSPETAYVLERLRTAFL
jgi:hypothetical protein